MPLSAVDFNVPPVKRNVSVVSGKDKSGREIMVTVPLEYELDGHYIFDEKGNELIYETKYDSRRSEYDEFNNLVYFCDGEKIWSKKFDEDGKLVWQDDAEGNVIWYDSYGRIIRQIFEDGSETHDEYDSFGRKVHTVHKHSFEDVMTVENEYYEYDSRGNMIYDKVLTNKVTSYGYDDDGNITYEAVPENDVLSYEEFNKYDEDNNHVSMLWKDYENNEILSMKKEYDSHGKLICESNRNTIFCDSSFTVLETCTTWKNVYEYDSKGRVSKVRHSSFRDADYVRTFIYDENETCSVYLNGELLRIVTADGRNLFINEAGRRKIWYNENGQIIHEAKPSEEYTCMYDAGGNMIRKEYTDGRLYEFKYDEKNNLLKEAYYEDNVLNESTEYRYDEDGLKTFWRYTSIYDNKIQYKILTAFYYNDCSRFSSGQVKECFAYRSSVFTHYEYMNKNGK